MQKTLKIRNDIKELAAVNQFLENTGEEFGLSPALLMSLNLVVEEAVTNVIFYAYEEECTDPEIIITMSFEDDVLSIALVDQGKPFDPTAKADPDITLSVEERPIGGLGIFLIKKIMDEVSYQRIDDKNVFIMKKRVIK